MLSFPTVRLLLFLGINCVTLYELMALGTAEDFLKPRSGVGRSYDVFIQRMASALNTKEEFIDVFSVVDSATMPGFVDVRFTAHGSPYYNSTKLIGAVLADTGVSMQRVVPWSLGAT